MRSFSIFCLFVFHSLFAFADPPLLDLTGNDLIELYLVEKKGVDTSNSFDEIVGYAMKAGYFRGYTAGHYTSTIMQDTRYQKGNYLNNVTPTQIDRVFGKCLEDNPEMLHLSGAILFRICLEESFLPKEMWISRNAFRSLLIK